MDVPAFPEIRAPVRSDWPQFAQICKWLVVMLAVRVFGADLLTLGGV